MKYFISLMALWVTCCSAALAQEGGDCVAAETASPDCEQALPETTDTWLDNGRTYVGSSADNLAGWIDTFFSEPRSDFESADSLLRLTFDSQFREDGENSQNIKLRGKIHLPGVNKRLSVVFADEDGDSDATTADEDFNGLTPNKEDTQLSLQYKARESSRMRVDYGLGISSTLKGKARLRYRYQVPWSESTTHRLIETLHFVDGEGFGLLSRYELDHKVSDSQLLRWASKANYAEDIEGVEWSTRLSLAQRFNKKRGVSLFSWVSGVTRPDYLTTSYGAGVLFRRNFYRSWLFFEAEPAYAWRKESVELDRNGQWQFDFRVEMLID